MRACTVTFAYLAVLVSLHTSSATAQIIEPRYLEEMEVLTAQQAVQNAMDRVEELDPWGMELLVELTEIPAPPFMEDVRAMRFAELLREVGADSVWIDSEGNAVGLRRGRGGGRTVAFGGHLDTVFPEGTDVTVVTIAGSIRPAIAVAEEMESDGVSVEIIDPRTIVPLDTKTILESVEKTGRLVIVDPAHQSCSVASEISSIVSQEGFWSLQAPIQRVTSLDCHFPFSPALEHLVYPNEDKIADAIQITLD